jgi:hypothetical protein
MIVKFLKWALSKFENKPVEVWPFPVEQTPKAKPALKKATTRKPVAKKIVKNAEKIVKKKAK